MTQLPADVPSVVKAAEPFVTHYGYLGVAFLLLLESTGIPVPGETTLIVAALFAGLGDLNIFAVIVVGIIAAMLGDNIAFAIGDWGGRKLILKYGKYVFITDEKLSKLEKFFAKYGAAVVIFARFVDGLRQLNGFIAGLSDMKWLRFLLFNFIGATIWVTVWASVGYFASNYISTILKYELYVSAAVVVAAIFFIARFVYKARKESA